MVASRPLQRHRELRCADGPPGRQPINGSRVETGFQEHFTGVLAELWRCGGGRQRSFGKRYRGSHYREPTEGRMFHPDDEAILPNLFVVEELLAQAHGPTRDAGRREFAMPVLGRVRPQDLLNRSVERCRVGACVLRLPTWLARPPVIETDDFHHLHAERPGHGGDRNHPIRGPEEAVVDSRRNVRLKLIALRKHVSPRGATCEGVLQVLHELLPPVVDHVNVVDVIVLEDERRLQQCDIEPLPFARAFPVIEGC